MSDLDIRGPQADETRSRAERAADRSARTQFKSSLKGMSYAQQKAAVQPATAPVQMLAAVQLAGDPAAGNANGTINGVVTDPLSVDSAVTTSDPPVIFADSFNVYKGNFDYVTARIRTLCADPAVHDPAKVEADIAKITAKKMQWYDKWAKAASSTDAAGAMASFQEIYNELKGMFPADQPEAGGGHLYTGRAGGAKAKDEAEAAATAETARSGIKHTTLEQTLIGHLFDNVAGGGPLPGWVQWGDVVKQWWSHISEQYANTFQGAVTCHVSVGIPYFFKRDCKPMTVDKTADEVRAMAASGAFNGCTTLDPSSVFAADELKRLADLMNNKVVTSMVVDLKVESRPGNVVSGNVTVTGEGQTHEGLKAAITAQIRALVTVEDFLSMSGPLKTPAAPTS